MEGNGLMGWASCEDKGNDAELTFEVRVRRPLISPWRERVQLWGHFSRKQRGAVPQVHAACKEERRERVTKSWAKRQEQRREVHVPARWQLNRELWQQEWQPRRQGDPQGVQSWDLWWSPCLQHLHKYYSSAWERSCWSQYNSILLQNKSIHMAFAIKHIRELLEIFKELDSLVLKTVVKLQSNNPQA